MRGVAARAVLGLAVFGFCGAVSCSLGLDESLIAGADSSPDGDAVDDLDGGFGEGSVDSGVPEPPRHVACERDEDCVTTHGCLRGTCDLSKKACRYDVCRPQACRSAVCDLESRSCGEPSEYKYHAARFPVGGVVSCAKCAAAVHPWLFVVTSTGVVAFDVSNPANEAPRTVDVVGLGFVPKAMVQSDDRVWMLGDATGAGPSRVQVAFIDPPADPFATKIEAHTVLATYDRPGELLSLFARKDGSALLVGPSNEQTPTSIVEAPLEEPARIEPRTLSGVTDFTPHAVSGERLLFGRINGQQAQFRFVEQAGTPDGDTKATVTLTDPGAVSTARAFAQGPVGVVFWATGVHQGIGVGTSTRAARGYFLVGGEAAPIDQAVTGIDIELYNAGGGVNANVPIFGALQATAAMLDSKTAMIATRSRTNASQTAVQFVTREPLGIVQDGEVARRQVLPVEIGTFVAATASHGIGYLVANDQVSQANPTATVYVFDPACPR